MDWRRISVVRLLLIGTVLCAAGCPGVPADGDGVERSFTADLSGDQEVPAVDTGASGTGTFTLNAAETQLTYSITVTGLSGPIAGAHFHDGAPGVAGPILFDITATVDEDPDGSLTAAGTWNVAASDVAALLAGDVYVNFHTDQNPAGEARGQLILEE